MNATSSNFDLAPLFEPLSLGSLHLRNRFVMAPMTRGFTPHGVPGPNVAAYYTARAAGGTGLIITEGAGIDHPASLGYNAYNGEDIPLLYGATALEGWKAVVDAVHCAGGKIAPQLWHQGPMRLQGTAPYPDRPSCRPSGIWGPPDGQSTISPEDAERLLPITRPMTESEIGDVIAGFARSAKLAQDAGFDAIAIHGAHGYLIDSFFWSKTNLRSDGWGGDISARSRFAVEVIRAVRATIREDLPIIFRFSQWKQQDFKALLANSPDELGAMLGPLADAGVDVFDASTRNFDVPEFEGSDLTLAGWTRKLTGRLTMAVGGVGLDKDIYASFVGGSRPTKLDPVVRRLTTGEFDLIAIGRGMVADPDWVRKVEQNVPRSSFDPAMLSHLL